MTLNHTTHTTTNTNLNHTFTYIRKEISDLRLEKAPQRSLTKSKKTLDLLSSSGQALEELLEYGFFPPCLQISKFASKEER